MVKRLETEDDISQFIHSGDENMDAEWFWDQLGVSARSLAGLCNFMATIHKEQEAIDSKTPRIPVLLMMAMEFGARLALRISSEELALGKEK